MAEASGSNRPPLSISDLSDPTQSQNDVPDTQPRRTRPQAKGKGRAQPKKPCTRNPDDTKELCGVI